MPHATAEQSLFTKSSYLTSAFPNCRKRHEQDCMHRSIDASTSFSSKQHDQLYFEVLLKPGSEVVDSTRTLPGYVPWDMLKSGEAEQDHCTNQTGINFKGFPSTERQMQFIQFVLPYCDMH